MEISLKFGVSGLIGTQKKKKKKKSIFFSFFMEQAIQQEKKHELHFVSSFQEKIELCFAIPTNYS